MGQPPEPRNEEEKAPIRSTTRLLGPDVTTEIPKTSYPALPGPTTTLAFYAHWIPRGDKALADRLESMRQSASEITHGITHEVVASGMTSGKLA